ncbi:hypothetical protein MOUN0_B04148 [Monosporozyma unispora]
MDEDQDHVINDVLLNQDNTPIMGISIEEYCNLQIRVGRVSNVLIYTGEGSSIFFPILLVFRRVIIIPFLLLMIHIISAFLMVWFTYCARNKHGIATITSEYLSSTSSLMKGYNVSLWWIRYLVASVFLTLSINIWYLAIVCAHGEEFPPDVVSGSIFCLFVLGILNGLAIFVFKFFLQPELHGWAFMGELPGDIVKTSDLESTVRTSHP